MLDLRTHLDALTDDERMVRDAASAYCRRDPEFKRVRALRGQRPGHEPQAWATLAEMGWLGGRLPEDLGGTALTHTQMTLLLEEFGGSLAPEPLTAVAVLAAGALVRADNAPLKAQWLPRLADGGWLPSLAWQDAGGAPGASGPDADTGAVLRSPSRVRITRARRVDGGYLLDGAKAFVPGADSADAFIVSAQTERGMGLFLVPRDASGLSIALHDRIDGGTWSTLTLSDVRVNDDAVLCTSDDVAARLDAALDEARLAVAAELVGLMARVLSLTVDYVRVRKQFDQPVGAFQAVQHRAVDLLVQVEMSRAVLRHAAVRFDATDDPIERARLASQVKARCSEAALTVAKGAVQLHGGIAYTDECNVGLFLKRAMVLATWLGNAAEHRRRHGALAHAGVGKGAAGADASGARTGTPADAHSHAGRGRTAHADAHEATDTLEADVDAFVAEHFPPEWKFPPARLSLAQSASWQSALAERGWMAPGWPKEHGGMGLSAYDQIRMADAFDRHGIFLGPNMGVTMLGPLLLRYGTEEQRRTHLPPILAGTRRWCQGYSEPGAGSDLAGLRTSAVLEGDTFVVNGQKIWTSFAHEADWIFLLVRTDPTAKKQNGISFLLVDMRTPGITVRPIRNLTGESEFCETFFDNVRVPAANLVGELNRGWTMAKALLGSERIMIGSPRLAKYPLQLLRDLLQSHGRFDDPATRARFDALWLDVEDLGALFVRMAEVLRRGGELGAEVSMLKLWVSEATQRVTDLMLEVAGEAATLDAPLALEAQRAVHVANQYFASRPTTIYGGSSEVQRNILARAVLQLPDR